ncbi:MAG: type II toxin-antitoxin system mRNA interferase toxin, RelE/StbE family [Holophagae bacterium]|nr:MAG: type II toxin-antitoxin system mRNA interferase toxin, RelE/StbE family [Holophagae bacterium]
MPGCDRCFLQAGWGLNRRQIIERIGKLASDPRPRGCEKLAGASGRFRVRQGAYRIVHAVADDERVVVVFKVGRRSEVHR